MRTLFLTSLLLIVATLVRTADAANWDGTWKVLVQTYDDHEFLSLKLEGAGDKLTGKVLKAQSFLEDPKLKSVVANGNSLRINLVVAEDEAIFDGTLATEGPNQGKVLGVFEFRENFHPAQLVKSDDADLAALSRGPITSAVGALSRIDPKQRVGELRDLITKHAGSVTLYHAYGSILMAAEEAELSLDEVRDVWKEWSEKQAAYGPIWHREIREYAVAALRGKKPYASFALELSQAAEESLPENASIESRAAVAGALAEAARLSGNDALAKTAAARAEKFEQQLDKQYLEKVPPFKPESFDRKNAENDGTVLVELFTGAQCPPCVASDVAFDALAKTFKSTDVILLQYHLHSPGPDPLANEVTNQRSEYYVLPGTPTMLFNGMNEVPGGGDLAVSEALYQRYREAIAAKLAVKKRAEVKLTVERKASKLQISVQAKAETEGDARPVLRLALVEKSIRYQGTNGIRIHRHVVRSMPGGVAGIRFRDGVAEGTLAVELDDLKLQLSKYLTHFEETIARFSGTKPPIEFGNLAVVAFVQDDDNKAVWHAVQADVPQP